MKAETLRALAEAADDNMAVHGGWLQSLLPGMQRLDLGGVLLVDSGLPCDTFNLICRARLDEAAEQRIDAALAHFRDAGRPFSWWVGPGDRPAHLGELLMSAGLRRAETELAMAVELSGLPASPTLPPGFTIERARTAQQVRAFAEINAANWTPPDPWVLRFYETASGLLVQPECPLRLYVGYVEGEAVASAELTLGGGVAGLYNIATRAAWRRRGLGSAMVAHLMKEACAAGMTTAVLQAAADGVRIYEGAGFRRFGDITEYKPALI